MQTGTRVKHKLTGIEMTIKKIYGSVASCNLDEKDWFSLHDKSHQMIKIQVCAIENLIVIPYQTTLF